MVTGTLLIESAEHAHNYRLDTPIHAQQKGATWKACSTLMASLADVSKYGMFPFCWHHAVARFCDTCEKKS